jgi:hypothetical protein
MNSVWVVEHYLVSALRLRRSWLLQHFLVPRRPPWFCSCYILHSLSLHPEEEVLRVSSRKLCSRVAKQIVYVPQYLTA